MKPWRVLWLIVVFTVSLTSAAVAGEPSGFRYDGTGVFPGCKPVTTWNEYEYKTVREGRSRRDVVTADKPVNIAWKTELPFWGNGQPVLVGGKLYLLREMRFWDSNELGPSLVCIDADSGKVEWSREVRHLDLIPQDAREKIVAAWVEDRQYIARKWQLAWRMHQANPDDKQELAKIWAEMKAMGFSNKKLSGQEGQKISDHHMGDTGRFWGGDPKARQQIRNRGGKSRGVEEGIMAVRLKLTGPDKVTPEVLWSTGRTSEGSFGRGIVYHDGLVFATTRKAVAVLDANTGKVLKTTGARTGTWNLTVAGGYVFNGDDNKAEISVLTADRQLRHVATNRVGQEIKKPDDQWHYRNEKGEWGVAGTPMPLYFDDDKVYLRTWFHLYCFQASE